jgi:threonine synthase
VNSINWARVLAQVVYYFTAAVSLGAPHRAVSFCVPTGNFGDIFAGHIAKRMGLPIEQADRGHEPERHPAPGAVSSGDYVPDGVTPTISPSMDIQVSSNFERALFDAYGRDGGAVAQLMEELKAGGFTHQPGRAGGAARDFASGRASEEETSAMIARARMRAMGELLCPHSAVGVHVAQEFTGTRRHGHAGHRASREIPRRGGGRHRHPPALPARMADLMTGPSG